MRYGVDSIFDKQDFYSSLVGLRKSISVHRLGLATDKQNQNFSKHQVRRESWVQMGLGWTEEVCLCNYKSDNLLLFPLSRGHTY